MTTKTELMAMVAERDELDAKIETAMTELKMTAKDVKAVKKAEAALEAQRKTLAELMGDGIVTAEQGAELGADTQAGD